MISIQLQTLKKNDPTNDLERWINKKNNAELRELSRATGVHRRPEKISVEYALLLDQVTNISGPDDDKSNE